MVDAGDDAVVLEASSHGSHYRRLDRVRFDALAFTNLSQDHLDLHGDMEEYFQAKRRLFTGVAPPPAAVNVGDPYGRRLADELAGAHRAPVVTFGVRPEAEVRADASSSVRTARWTVCGRQIFGAVERTARKARAALSTLNEARSLGRSPTQRLGPRQGGRGAAGARGRAGSPALDALPKEGMKERIAWQLERVEATASRRIGIGMGVLATIGATSPFVGLFGTVWGIMNSFIGISKAHTTSLAVVAPGIAEALLATAIGLVAAIPAVVIYNVFSRSIGGYRAMLADASANVLRLVAAIWIACVADPARGRGVAPMAFILDTMTTISRPTTSTSRRSST